MKNLLRVMLCLSLVFVLTKIQLNGPKLYLGKDGKATSNVLDAVKYETCGEAYDIQIKTSNEWDIESIY